MDGRIDQDFNQPYRWKIPNTVGAYRIRPPDLNQDEWDKRMDQELVLNQDALRQSSGYRMGGLTKILINHIAGKSPIL